MSASNNGSGLSATASNFRQQLASLTAGHVAHRDLADRYRAILEEVLQHRENDLVDGLKVMWAR